VISSTAESKAAHRHAALQQIEHRLTIVLAKMANLKVEQARLQAESAELMQRREWIINPTLLPPPKPPTFTPDGRNREECNAYMREYMAKRREEGRLPVRDRAKYNAYHKEYQRNLRAKQRAEKQTQIAEHRNGITTQITEHQI
jgi:hypothetical protein